jgi:rubrerythrin
MMGNIDDLLHEALNAELKAKEFYTRAASKAQSSKAKDFFTQMAEFEQNHYDRVKNIMDGRQTGTSIQPPSAVEIPMIKPEIQGEIEPNKDEIIDVINKAVQAEKEAQERYRTIAQMMETEVDKMIFNDLAEEESKHQRILEDQFYHMSNKGTIIWGE